MKVRADPHEPDPEQLQLLKTYVLMARTRIDPEQHEVMTPQQALTMKREWVEDAERKGHMAGHADTCVVYESPSAPSAWSGRLWRRVPHRCRVNTYVMQPGQKVGRDSL